MTTNTAQNEMGLEDGAADAKTRPKKSSRWQMAIPVTEAVISESVRKSSSHCMIADAISANIPGVTKVSVDLQTIRFSDPSKGVRYTYLTPRAAQVALLNFDRGVPPSPFKLKLRAPQITSLRKKDSRELEHKFGEKRLAAKASDKRNGTVPATVGGNPPPVSKVGRRREFGLRNFSLDDVIPMPGHQAEHSPAPSGNGS